ncbi:MAG: hypothetical protein ABI873_03160 [Marmoricola sp.]
MASSTSETEAAPRLHPARSGAAAVSGGVVAVVVVAWFLALTLTGSPVGDVLGWSVAVLVGVLAPGFVVVRVSRRGSAPLIEDVSWAAAAGCLVALVGWFLDRVLPVSPGPFLVGPLVVVLGLCIPQARRRVLARPAPGWGMGPSLVLGGVLLVSVAWMLKTGLLAYRPDPGVFGRGYYPDVMYQLDLLGGLRNSLVPSYPSVAGTSLSYHWFLYAVTANLTTHTGVGLFDSTLRLAPATLVPAILMLSAVVARRLSGRVWAGPLAAILLGVVDLSEASKWTTEDGSTGILPRIWRSSPPQTMGWLASMAAAGVLFAFLRRSPGDRAVPVALFLPFLVLAAGSKSSELPVLVAGVALAAAVQLVRRDWAQLRRCVMALALMLTVFGVASVTIYGSSSYGVQRQLFGVAIARMYRMFPGQGTKTSSLFLNGTHSPAIAVATVSVMFLLPLLPRLLGGLLQVGYRVSDSAGWVCLGTAGAGLLLPFVVRHPAGSELYFMLSAYPIGVVGAASGLVLAADRARGAMPRMLLGRRLGWWLAGLVVAGALSAAAVAYSQPRFDPVHRWALHHPHDPRARRLSALHLARLWLTPDLTLLAVLAVLAVIVAVVLWRARPAAVSGGRSGAQENAAAPAQPRGGRVPIILLSTMSLLLGTGVFTTALTFHGTDTPVQGSVAAVPPPTGSYRGGPLPPTMRDAMAAGRYVDEHAGPNDVVATNMYCRVTPAALRRGKPCDSRNFVAAALTQRRTLVGGWGYADRIVSNAWTLKVAYRNAPFWDQALLKQELTAIGRPSTAVLADLYRRHRVRWIFVDLRNGGVDVAALSRLARLCFHGPSTDVWQLRRPA